MRIDRNSDAILKTYPEIFERFLSDIDHHTTGEIITHPKFNQIRRWYVLETTGHYAADTFPGGWQSTAYRVMILGTLLDLYDAWDPADPKTLPTPTRLKQTIALLGLSSSRLVDDFIRRLVQTGHVVLDRFDADGRVRLLKPSDSTLGWYSKTTASYYSILDSLYPESGYDVAASHNASFRRAQRISASKIFSIIVEFLSNNRDLYPFHSMNFGGVTLMHLAVSEDETTYDFLQRRHGVTRSQYRNIVLAAEEGKLLSRSAKNGKVLDLTERGHFAVDRFIGDTLSSHDMTFRMAMTRMRNELDSVPTEMIRKISPTEPALFERRVEGRDHSS